MTAETATSETSRSTWRDRWVEAKRSLRTRETYSRGIDGWFAWCDRNGIDVWRAEQHDVDRYRNGLAAGYGPASIRRELATVSSFYRHVLRNGRPAPFERNPVEWVERPPRPKSSSSVALDVDETDAVRAVSIATSPRTAAVVHLLLGTAVRVSEACGATVDDLVETRDGGRLLRVTRKGGERQEVAIPSPEWEVIAHYLDTRKPVPDRWLLATTGGRRMTRQTAYRIVQETAWKVTQRTKVGPHDLRHTTATQALDAGVAVQEVQGMLGHASAATTQLYDRHAGARGHGASRRVSELYAELARKREAS